MGAEIDRQTGAQIGGGGGREERGNDISLGAEFDWQTGVQRGGGVARGGGRV